MADPNGQNNITNLRRAPVRAAAEKLLREELQDGPRPGRQLVALAKARGISKSTLDQTRVLMGIKCRRESTPGVSPGAGRWLWELDPEEAEEKRRDRLINFLMERSERSDLPASQRAHLKLKLDRFIRQQEARGGL